ncbi:MAG: RNA-binding S4 domain-containing protein [Actinomycetota bacterium]|jgi:ribosomal 50S subunit-recycling heat shock protein|nr:RNA-binding S4 domain-containing protein [Actinomycetota bacterium]
MRLDKFLQVSRLIKRRTVAKEVAEEGRVRLNGRTARPATPVFVGDHLRIELPRGPIEVEVLEVREHVPAKLAASLYRLVEGRGQALDED